jgi:hypothetical protein
MFTIFPMLTSLKHNIRNAYFIKGTWQSGGFSGVFAEIGFS